MTVLRLIVYTHAWIFESVLRNSIDLTIYSGFGNFTERVCVV